MAPRSIKFKTLMLSIMMILATELFGMGITRIANVSPLIMTGFMRIIQITVLIWVVAHHENGLCAIGWEPISWRPGFIKGVIWSVGFGVFTAIAMTGVYFAGLNPMQMVKSPLPSSPLNIALLFFVGGLIAPVAEELCFRGIVYTFFRRWGIFIALVASTTIFVVLHIIHGVPIIPIVGGIVFAIAYETSGNLTVPITIHCLGNIAIFALSLF